MCNRKLKIEIEAKVFGEFDTIVCGGGTAGVVAALAAARNGAKTLLLESGHYLGGMMTMGNAGLTKFVQHGIDTEEQYRINKELEKTPEKVQVAGGIPLEIANQLIKDGNAVGTFGTGASYVYTDSHAFKLYLFEELKKAGVKIMLHSKVIKVLREGNRITGVIFDAAKEGAIVAYASYIVDATGDGDVAVLAGVEHVVGAAGYDAAVLSGKRKEGSLDVAGSMYRIGGINYDKFIQYIKENPEEFHIQKFGQMGWDEFFEAYEKGESVIAQVTHGPYGMQLYNYPREGITIGCLSVKTRNLNGLLAEDLTQAEYEVLQESSDYVEKARKTCPGFENAYVCDVPRAGIRETRHIFGEYRLTIVDVLTNKEFEDTIGLSSHPIDISPKPKECEDIPVAQRAFFRIPYRCLVAKGVDNLLLCGRMISATREASGCTRVTVCCMVTGEAAGTAAAILSKDGGAARDIDICKLRTVLKENGVKC